jgi:hypothetical protein
MGHYRSSLALAHYLSLQRRIPRLSSPIHTAHGEQMDSLVFSSPSKEQAKEQGRPMKTIEKDPTSAWGHHDFNQPHESPQN